MAAVVAIGDISRTKLYCCCWCNDGIAFDNDFFPEEEEAAAASVGAFHLIAHHLSFC